MSSAAAASSEARHQPRAQQQPPQPLQQPEQQPPPQEEQPGEPQPDRPNRLFTHPRAAHAIIAATRQRGNPILGCVRSTQVEFAEGLVPDYLAGPEIVVLFISLRFHRLHPEYLKRRIEATKKARRRSRVLLCRVDVEHPEEQLESVTLQAFEAKLSLVLAWTDAEAAAYLETLHRQQNKGAEALMAKLPQGDKRARLAEVLASVKGVNRTDASRIMDRFGSLAGVARAAEEDLLRCSGIGDKKVRRLHQVFHTPFFPD